MSQIKVSVCGGGCKDISVPNTGFVTNINNYQKDEYLIGDVIKKLIKENKIKVYVDETDSLCIGITYKEDVELFNKLINKNN